MLESDLSKIRGFHTLVDSEMTAVGYHNAFLDHRKGERVLRCSISSDRDQVEDGSSIDHRDARNSHGVKLRFTPIIALKSRDGLSDDLWLGVANADGGVISPEGW